MAMRTTIKLTWHTDISIGEYAGVLQDIARAIDYNKNYITDIRSNTETIQTTPGRKIRKKKEPTPPSELAEEKTGGEVDG